MSLMFLDIATIPDFELGTRLYNLHDLSEKDVSRVMATKNRETGDNTGVLPQHMQRILAISVLFQDKEGIKIWSLGDAESNEADLLRILERYTEEYKPDVVTWSGAKTILPILNYRYLSHCIQLPLFASQTNLLEELAGTNNNVPVSLHDLAVVAGYPGNQEMTAEEVMNNYLQGDIEPVRNNLELNLTNSWLVYKHWQLVNKKIDQAGFEAEKELLVNTLRQEDRAHLTSFVDALNK